MTILWPLFITMSLSKKGNSFIRGILLSYLRLTTRALEIFICANFSQKHITYEEGLLVVDLVKKQPFILSLAFERKDFNLRALFGFLDQKITMDKVRALEEMMYPFCKKYPEKVCNSLCRFWTCWGITRTSRRFGLVISTWGIFLNLPPQRSFAFRRKMLRNVWEFVRKLCMNWQEVSSTSHLRRDSNRKTRNLSMRLRWSRIWGIFWINSWKIWMKFLSLFWLTWFPFLMKNTSSKS